MTASFLRRASRRGRPALALALLTPLVTLLVDPAPAAAEGNNLWFQNLETHTTAGPNAAIFIDGTIVYDGECSSVKDGTKDFLYPVTDVYVVAHGSATSGTKLEDAAGGKPNTIIGTGPSGPFVGELIAVTSPSGKLGAGVYDVVYDTCQDGKVGPNDTVFDTAVTVELPDGALPPVSPSIARLKEQAHEQYVFWLQTQLMLRALFHVQDARVVAACILSQDTECLEVLVTKLKEIDKSGGLIDTLKDATLRLALARARNYGAIWQDPPDADYRQLPVVVPEPVSELPASGSPVADALDALDEPLAQEGALAEALLHAMERYQGAQAAGDEEWVTHRAEAKRYDDRRMLRSRVVSILIPCRWLTRLGSSS